MHTDTYVQCVYIRVNFSSLVMSFVHFKLLHKCFLLCLNSEETIQLRRKVTWEKGPTTGPRTRELRSNAEFQPH